MPATMDAGKPLLGRVSFQTQSKRKVGDDIHLVLPEVHDAQTNGTLIGSRGNFLARFGIMREWPEVVQLTILAQYLNATFSAIMLGGLFNAYLLIEGGSNMFVGSIESVRGITSLVLALPIGWLGDRFPKSRILRYDVIVGSVGAVLLVSCLACFLSHTVVCFWLCLELCVAWLLVFARLVHL